MKKKFDFQSLDLYTNDSKELVQNTYLSLCCSGTITLEHAILQKPCIVIYKFSLLSYWILKLFLLKKIRNKIGYMSIANSLLKKEVLPEFLQNEAYPKAIIKQVDLLLNNQNQYLRIQSQLKDIATELHKKDCFEEASLEILKLINYSIENKGA